MKAVIASRVYRLFTAIALSVLGVIVAYFLQPYVHYIYDAKYYEGIHAMLELLSIFVSFAIFTVVWLIRDGLDDYQGHFLLFLGINFVTVGVFDLLHIISFDGVFNLLVSDTNQAASIFWLLARYWLAFAFLVSLILMNFKFNKAKMANIYLAINIVFILSVLHYVAKYSYALPLLYTDDLGVTALKVHLEYWLIIVYAAALLFVWFRTNGIGENIFLNLVYFVVLTTFSEIMLTLNKNICDAYDIFNLLGHVYKSIAYYFLFRAVYCSGIINHFYTLGEMAKMSAELLKDTISLEPILEIQMNKLKKIIPKAERITVYICEKGGDYHAAYIWGKYSNYISIGQKFNLNNLYTKFGNHLVILNEPLEVLETFKYEGYSTDIPIEIPLILKRANYIMYMPLASDADFYGWIILYIFNSIHRFTADDTEKAEVFQRFATLSLAQAKSHETIARLSYEDILTGLPNRRYFINELRQILSDPNAADLSFTIVYLDMNGLKYVNDNLGHAAGDQALRMIGRLLKEATGKSGIPARLGGDEFAILYQGVGLTAGQDKVCYLKEHFSSLDLAGFDFTFSLAVGGVSYPEEAKDEDTLLKIADDRMYEHKRKIKAAQDKNNVKK